MFWQFQLQSFKTFQIFQTFQILREICFYKWTQYTSLSNGTYDGHFLFERPK